MKSDTDVQKRAVSTDCCERLLKLVCHKAAGRSDTEAYVLGTVRWTGDRERSERPVSVADQWRKWRIPVRIIAIPCSSAALTISASRIDPPG